MSIRNPKSEVRSPDARVRACAFGFWAWEIFRFSVFGFLVLSGYASFSSLASDDIPPLAPPLPEIPPSPWEQFGWLLWILVPLLLVALGLLVWLLLRPGRPPILPAPAAQARAAIVVLQSQPEEGAVLSRISQTLRRYLISAFWLQPDEATTAEFCTRLQESDRVGPELAAAIGNFLRQCDEQKFSPVHVTAPFKAAQRALELVELAEVRCMKLRAGALDCGGPPPLSSNADAKSKPPRP